VNVGALMVPVALSVCVCSLSADPVNVGADTVPAGVYGFGVSIAVPTAIPIKPVVNVCGVPVNTGAEIVPAGVPPDVAQFRVPSYIK
jgi:hypothetical protein